MKTIPILYVYDEVTGSFKSITGLYFNRIVIHENTPKEQELCFATNSLKKVNYTISNRPNRVYYDSDTLVYTIWMNEAKEDFARKKMYKSLCMINHSRIDYHNKRASIHRIHLMQANAFLKPSED